MTSRAILWVDETVAEYADIRLPGNWTVIYRKRWGGIAAAMRWVLKNYPRASQYGWLADDSFPRSEGWDKKIEEAAGDWRLASGQDLYISTMGGHAAAALGNGWDFGAPMCWGGKLVRKVGWWALPGVRQAGIDTAWSAIIRPLGLHVYASEVICEHMNYRTGKRVQDETDNWVHNGVNYVQADIDRQGEWAASRALPLAIERVRKCCQ